MDGENPFIHLKDLVEKLLEPLEENVKGLMIVVYGDRANRKDSGLQGEVEKNVEFRITTVRSRKWLVTTGAFFILTTISNLIMMILALLGKLPILRP